MIIGIDVGGTHTDGIIIEKGKVLASIKIPTNKENLYSSIIGAVDSILENTEPGKIKRVVLSTTLTTNAIVQKKTEKTAVIVSSGPGINPKNHEIGDLYKVVKGSLDHRGRELTPIDESEIRDLAKEIKSQGIKNIAVVSKFSPRNPDHENKKEEILSSNFENIFKGHNVSGSLNFPRRINTTWLNASVHEAYKEFFLSVDKSFREKGINAPVHILKADGGTMPLKESVLFPAQTIFSGPAASVMGALPSAHKNHDTIILDVGGTTTDMAILARGVPVLAPNGIEIENIKTMIRAIETKSIGIGGDSFIEVTDDNIKIGPLRKGPAMAFGGETPTPVDAFVFLGKIDSPLKDNSVKGITELSKKINKSPEDTADLIIEKTAEKIVSSFKKMVGEINEKPVYTLHDFLEGYVVDPKTILILGGPAKVLTEKIEEISGIKTIAVKDYNVANAIGAAMAKPTCSVTLFADTQRKIAHAPEENYMESISLRYSKEDAYSKAEALLYEKAEKMGTDMENIEIETIEDLSFNMVRGYRSAGKNIRLTLQVKPGLISD